MSITDIDTTTRLHNISNEVDAMHSEVSALLDHADMVDFHTEDPYTPTTLNRENRYRYMCAAASKLEEAMRMLDIAHTHSINVDKE